MEHPVYSDKSSLLKLSSEILMFNGCNSNSRIIFSELSRSPFVVIPNGILES